jgi:hypothetical protein
VTKDPNEQDAESVQPTEDYTTPEELMRYAFHMEPVFEQKGEVWVGSYPTVEWSVTAPTEAQAREKLGEEFIKRQNAGEDARALAYADEVHLRHLRKPIPGLYAMDNEVYLQLRDEPWTEHGRAFKEAEAKRLRGETYTKEDYLRRRES